MSVCKDLSYLCILHVHFCMCRADDELSLDVVCLYMYVCRDGGGEYGG